MYELSKALSDVLEGGYVQEDVIKTHIELRATLDQILLNTDSFFYVFELRTQKYHYIGKQQETITGYKNEDFLKQGFQLFLQRLHPEEISSIVNKVYKDLNEFFVSNHNEDKKNLLFHYNYRFRRKDDEYINLIELINILEVDKDGRPALFLGNVIVADDKRVQPLQAIGKKITDNGISETVFTKCYTPQNHSLKGITRRELDILKNLALGKTSKEIAKELYISPNTVDTHRRNLMKKFSCKSVVELARLAYQNSL